MKKILLASVGVFAFTAFGAQAAEPVKLSIGGYMFQQFGYASNDLDGYGDVDQQGYSDVTFSGESKFDNGLTAGVNVTMRASQASSSYSGGDNKNVKYAYAYVGGKYGQVSLGQQQNVGALIHHSAPAFGLAAQDGDWMDWVDSADNRAVQTTYVNDDKSADKINLFTPVWNGLQAGFSYIPDTNVGNTGKLSMVPQYQTHGGDFSSGNMYAVGATYDTTFSNGVGLGFDVSYINGNVASNWAADPIALTPAGNQELTFQAIQTGLNVKYAGFTVGGSYLNRSGNGDWKSAVKAGNSWDLGVAYEANPWGVSLSYFGSKTRADVLTSTGKDYDKAQAFALAGKYNIGPGVELNGTIARVDYKSDSDLAARENKGWAVVSGVKVNF